MVINRKSYPIVDDIVNGRLKSVQFMSIDDDFSGSLNRIVFDEVFSKHSKNFSKELFVVSKSYLEAMYLAEDKIHDLISTDMQGESFKIDLQGCYIVKGILYACDLQFVSASKFSGAIYIFLPSGVPYAYMIRPITNIWISHDADIAASDIQGSFDYMLGLINILLYIKMFQLYAKSDIKIVKPKATLKKIEEGYLKNESTVPVTYLDSKWFTTIVRSEGFRVRGHFRLQPRKIEGEWVKRIIWIEDFMKTGYTSKAKVQDQQ